MQNSQNLAVNTMVENNKISKTSENDDSGTLNIIDEKLKKIGEKSLRKIKLATDESEIRVWEGFGTTYTQGLLLRNRKGMWSAKYIYFTSFTKEGKIDSFQINNPKSGWEIFWQRLKEQDIITILDDSEVGAVEPFEDSKYVVFEILIADKYRSYSYNAPCYSETVEGKKVVNILKILSEELDKDFLRC